MKEKIIEELKQLLKEEDVESTFSPSKELRAAYLQEVAAIQKEQKERFFAENEDAEEEDFVATREPIDETFDEIWGSLSKKQRDWKKEQEEQQQRNLDRKRAIIEAIRKITSEEEHIKTAFEKVKALEEEWKSVGAVPQDTYQELQAAYGKVRDEFFYNIRIYKELLEHDLKRNLQLKEEIVEKIKQLRAVEKIKEVESLIRSYTSEWDEIGPTFREEWENIKNSYYDAVKATYYRIKRHYQELKERQLSNLEKKQQLVEQLKKINQLEIQKEKKWRKFTDEVKAIQQEWKKIGFVPKEHNEAIWQEFKAQGDDFFANKRAFYEDLKAEQDKNKAAKNEIIQQVDALKEDEPNREAFEKIKALQNKWHTIGSCHQRDEQRLWKQFRAACNHFFEKQKEHRAHLKEEQEANYQKKLEQIEKLKAFEPSGDQKKDKETLTELSQEFNAIGFVPKNKIDEVQSKFRAVSDQKFKAAKLNTEQKSEVIFKQKLAAIKSGDNPDKIKQKEEKRLNDQIKKLESEIIQYENNLGFFGYSKGAQALKDEVEQKLQKTKDKLEKLKAQKKAISKL